MTKRKPKKRETAPERRANADKEDEKNKFLKNPLIADFDKTLV